MPELDEGEGEQLDSDHGRSRRAKKSLKRLGYNHIAYHVKASGVQANELLPAVHRASALRKCWILGTHQGAVSKELLDHYLDEFAFRHNRRYSRHRGLLFYRLAEQAMAAEPQPYAELLTPPASTHRKRRVKAAGRGAPPGRWRAGESPAPPT